MKKINEARTSRERRNTEIGYALNYFTSSIIVFFCEIRQDLIL